MRIPKSSPSGEMPFLDHLEELRWRIIYSLGALLVGVIIGFWVVFKYNVLLILQGPLLPFLHGQKLIYTHPADSFNILLQLSIVVGVVIALPVILYQLWLFLAPALHKHEKRMVIPVLASATLLFLVGVAMCWFLVMPMTLGFFFGLGSGQLTPMITVEDYFSFVTTMCLAFGGVFEVPIILVGMIALGIVTPQTLNRQRRWAILISYLVAAIVTPGDLFLTTLALAVPLYLLFEMSVVVGYVIWRRQQRRKAQEEADERRKQEEDERPLRSLA